MVKEKTTSKTVKKKAPKKGAGTAELNALKAEVKSLTDTVHDLTTLRDDLQTQADESKDQSLRAMAELENVKRRKEQEKADAIKFANEGLVMALLPILDSFDLAMQQGGSQHDEVQAVLTGFEMIQKQLHQCLEKMGVGRIDALNQPFDPNLHQGVAQESHPDKNENMVVKEMQPGYTLNDRVIRPSMVVVSTK